MSLEYPSRSPRVVTWSLTSRVSPSRKSAKALPVFEPLKRYRPRMLTPWPRPSTAELRVQSAPAFSEWAPMIQVRLSLTENEFCLIVRSALKPPSEMLIGRVELDPPLNWNAGYPTRDASMLGAVSRP